MQQLWTKNSSGNFYSKISLLYVYHFRGFFLMKYFESLFFTFVIKLVSSGIGVNIVLNI